MSLQQSTPQKRTCAWTTTEERLLTHLYPTGEWHDIAAALPRHTPAAITTRASKLKIKKFKAIPPSPIIEAIVKRRHELGLSQTEAAKLAKCCRTQVCRFERGLNNTSMKSLLRMCDTLGVELCIKPKRSAGDG